MRALNLLRLVLPLLVLGLAGAAFGVNLGPDDLQVSETGLPGTVDSDAVTPSVAFDSVNQRYLVVWSADPVDGDFHIFGQLLTGAGGLPIGSPFQISTAGPAGTDHRQPAVAFAPAAEKFQVVWSSDLLNPGAYEIFGRLIDTDGNVAGNVRRYSDMGTTDADTQFDAVTPDVAWHADLARFVVVWAGDDDTGDLADGHYEIYGQLTEATEGFQDGANDFRITFAGSGPDGYDVLEPAIAVVPGGDRWICVFEGDITLDGINNPDIWAYGCNADVPDPSGFNLSAMGGSYTDAFAGRNPDVAYLPSSGELICVWDGDAPGLPRSIYGQRFLADGTLAGGMVAMSVGAEAWYGEFLEAIKPAVAVDPVSDEIFVSWQGERLAGPLHHDHEIFARRFDDTGVAVETVASVLSDMDPSLEPVAGAGAPAVAINGQHGYKLIVWSGDLDTTLGGEHEIFVQAWADDNASPVDETPRPASFALHGAAPNPFNPSTTIAFDLPQAESVSLHIYDASGKLVRRLLSNTVGLAGRNEVVWNGRDEAGRQAASGVYLYRLVTDRHRDLGRMTLVK